MSTLQDRMARFDNAGLYFVTSEPLSAGRTTLDIMQGALDGGVRLIQLREKTYTRNALTRLAEKARTLTDAYDALLLINDYVDVALAVDADGVHLGLSDFPVDAARAIAPEMIIGASSHCCADFEAAQAAGASYVNIGPLFPTQTKLWDDAYLGMEGLREIATVAQVPFTVMGGIKKHHIPELLAAGVGTIALVTAISGEASPEAAARDLLTAICAS